MTQELEVGRYEFFPDEFEQGNESPEETYEKLKNLAEKFARKVEKINDEKKNCRNFKIASVQDRFS